MKKTLLFLMFLPLIFRALAQDDLAGPGRALYFDGTNDYVDLGNIYDDLTFPFTISTWIYQEQGATIINPIFVSQDNAPLYNGFWFCVTSTDLFIEYGDGRGEQNPAFRRGKSASIIPGMLGRWLHVAGVVRSTNDIELYLNGRNAGGAYTGSSTLPMASTYPGDVAKIGYMSGNSAIHQFKGKIDELRIFNKALSESEIRETMCRKLPTGVSGLIGYWTFDETSGATAKDRSARHLDGTLMSGTNRNFSGAPVGDISAFLYAGVWSGASISIDDVTASDIIGNPWGIQLYKVNSAPSQTNGLGSDSGKQPYYGVFIADDQSSNSFSVKKGSAAPCRIYTRKDNSVALWSATIQSANFQERAELIFINSIGEDMKVDLGMDKILCDQTSMLLQPTLNDATGKSFLWSTGETSRAITVTQTGEYSVTVSQGCQIDKDTISVSFFKTPPAFSLGPDEVLCSFTPRILNPAQAIAFEFTWHDGSHAKSYEAKDFGKYWLTLKSACGSFTDSITFSKALFDNNFYVDLGLDQVICDLGSATLKAGPASSPERSFLWSTGETSSSITVHQTGNYSVKVSQGCQTLQDTISVSILQSPPVFSLGADEVLCRFTPRVLEPVQFAGFDFTWHDGTHEKRYEVQDFGTYCLTVKNLCGSFTDSVTFSRFILNVEKIPNVITPNGDELNQYFVLDPLLSGVRLQILNRWGKEIYRSLNYQNNWDGSNIATGIYFYRLTSNCTGELKGVIHVLK